MPYILVKALRIHWNTERYQKMSDDMRVGLSLMDFILATLAKKGNRAVRRAWTILSGCCTLSISSKPCSHSPFTTERGRQRLLWPHSRLGLRRKNRRHIHAQLHRKTCLGFGVSILRRNCEAWVDRIDVSTPRAAKHMSPDSGDSSRPADAQELT